MELRMTDNTEFAQIDAPYMVLTLIPFYVDNSDKVWLDRLWLRDFERHSEYIQQLTLVAPRHEYRHDIPDLVCVGDRVLLSTRFIGLKPQHSLRAAVLSLPHTTRTLWREVQRSQIVHSHVSGWPFPLGWIANPMALLLKRKLVLVVESSPWRAAGNGPQSIKHRLMSWATEKLGTYFMNRADLAIATQPSYLASLRPAPKRGRGFVNPASWIDEQDVLSVTDAERSWKTKQADTASLMRMLFVGRLTWEKGVGVLLQAARELQQRKLRVRIDIIGDGELRGICEGAAAANEDTGIHLIPLVPYGLPFFALLRDYHAIVVPSLGQEQPRILFDAYSQAVPVIASDTDGIRPYVEPGLTGWLVPPGAASSLADTIEQLVSEPAALERCGLAARRMAEKLTHRSMHQTRSVELAQLLR
jgi:glycosyltransferase involved in cell wall biosynthesis